MSTPEKARKKRAGRGALLAIGILFFTSGLIRLAGGTGDALAREVEEFASRSDAADISPGPYDRLRSSQACEPDESLDHALAALRERTEALDRREKQVELRVVSVRRAEEVLQANLKALEEAETSLSATVARADGAAEEDIKRLISVYEQMKPKNASAIFEAMDPTFAAGFLAQMRADSAAAIMAGLSPSKAYSVSALLAGRNAGVPTE